MKQNANKKKQASKVNLSKMENRTEQVSEDEDDYEQSVIQRQIKSYSLKDPGLFVMFESIPEVMHLVTNLETQSLMFKILKEPSLLKIQEMTLPYLIPASKVDDLTENVLEKRLFALS